MSGVQESRSAGMTSRERVHAALSHKEPDRVPYDLGSLGPTGISLEAHANLLVHLGRRERAELGDLSNQRAKPSEAFLKDFGIDTRPVRCRAQRSWKMDLQEDREYFFYYDEWGVGRKMARQGGHHYFIFHHPLEAVDTADLARFPWPDPEDPARLDGVEEEMGRQEQDAQPAFVLGGPFSQGLLQFAAQLEGSVRFFTNLALDPYRAEWILEKLLELKFRFYRAALGRLGRKVDVVCESDDLGHQHSQWISADMFRKVIKPRYTSLFSSIKKESGAKVLFHSCGAIYPLIPEIADMGADILNPVQVGAAGMGDTRKLKREFGDALTFWGAGVDVQQTLPFESPSRVEDEVRRRIEDLAPGGGFVFAATQTIQPETPPENIVAMWKALQRYGIYHSDERDPAATRQD
jgi:uroporphyrinogen decarboxylase